MTWCLRCYDVLKVPIQCITETQLVGPIRIISFKHGAIQTKLLTSLIQKNLFPVNSVFSGAQCHEKNLD